MITVGPVHAGTGDRVTHCYELTPPSTPTKYQGKKNNYSLVGELARMLPSFKRPVLSVDLST